MLVYVISSLRQIYTIIKYLTLDARIKAIGQELVCSKSIFYYITNFPKSKYSDYNLPNIVLLD